MALERAIEILDEFQTEAAVAPLNVAVEVIAGAGSGKTTVIIGRTAHILLNGYKAERIKITTFSNEGAKNIVERMERYPEMSGTHCGTIHSFCYQILDEFREAAGFERKFVIVDSNDQAAICRRILKARGWLFHPFTEEGEDGIPEFALQGYISRRKNGFAETDLIKNLYTYRLERAVKFEEMYKEYEEIKAKFNGVDLDDLIIMVLDLFKKRPDIAATVKSRFDFLIIDEFQDTSKLQFELLTMLNDIPFVVGDPRQCIYEWRDAVSTMMKDFVEQYNANVYRLKNNYRSAPEIVQQANRFVLNAERFLEWEPLNSTGKKNGQVTFVQVPGDRKNQHDRVVELVQEEIKNGRPLEDICILARTNYLAEKAWFYLRKNEIPGTPVGYGDLGEFYDWIKMAIAAAATNDNHMPLVKLLTEPYCGIVKKVAWDLLKLANKDYRCHPIDLADKIMGVHLGIGEDKFKFVKNVLELVKLMKQTPLKDFDKLYEKIEETIFWRVPKEQKTNFREMLKKLSMVLQDCLENGTFKDWNEFSFFIRKFGLKNLMLYGKQVKLMTAHQSKGLEFPVVIIVGADNDMHPHYYAADERAVDEEMRVFYVAITRAKEHLYVVSGVGMTSTFVEHMQSDEMDSLLLV